MKGREGSKDTKLRIQCFRLFRVSLEFRRCGLMSAPMLRVLSSCSMLIDSEPRQNATGDHCFSGVQGLGVGNV